MKFNHNKMGQPSMCFRYADFRGIGQNGRPAMHGWSGVHSAVCQTISRHTVFGIYRELTWGKAARVKKCKQLGFNSIDEKLKTSRVPASRLPIDFHIKREH
jgi:hypothetical protein